MEKLSPATIKGILSPVREEMERAFSLLYQQYAPLVKYVALDITHDQGEADDIVDETFTRVYARRGEIKKEKNLKYLLLTIASNLAYDSLRKRREVVSYEDEISSSSDSKDDFMAYVESFKDFLDEDEVRIVVTHLLYGYTFAEIGAAFHVSTNSISSKYKRVIDKIKTHYGREAR